MKSDYKHVVLNAADNIAVALDEIPAGAKLSVKISESCVHLRILDSIEFGHKFAVRPIAKGDDILKYGEVIGRATADIPAGAHVHVHNLEGKRGRGDLLEAAN